MDRNQEVEDTQILILIGLLIKELQASISDMLAEVMLPKNKHFQSVPYQTQLG